MASGEPIPMTGKSNTAASKVLQASHTIDGPTASPKTLN